MPTLEEVSPDQEILSELDHLRVDLDKGLHLYELGLAEVSADLENLRKKEAEGFRRLDRMLQEALSSMKCNKKEQEELRERALRASLEDSASLEERAKRVDIPEDVMKNCKAS